MNDLELTFIILNFLGLIVSLGYFLKKLHPSGLMTVLLSALLLTKVVWLQWIGAVCVVLITICFLLFQTALGRWFLAHIGRDSTGRKL